MQIVTLTIGPAFYAAGIYFCLSQIVTTFGAENSRLPPKWYPRLFISCDFLSLLLQAIGGGMASAASSSGRDTKPGTNIMIAGLTLQVVTLLLFILLTLDFSIKTWRRIRNVGKDEALDPRHQALRQSRPFRLFLLALAFATLCIFTRSVYRVAELSEGWRGHLIQTQSYFIGLEGAIVVAGVLTLNIFHPGFCFRDAYD
jgi:RTA1 like protein